ncbi:hypothetical protein [Sulfurimonas sp.]|uniref:hypothetical protein n=1 Tax=Sulfurimonas sp. TaxID=2022749 RepID=UPI003568D067
MLETAKPIDVYPKKPYLAFVVPLDGRFRVFGGSYYPNLLKGISYIPLKARLANGVAVPLQKGGSLWLSLFGKESYKEAKIAIRPGAMVGYYNIMDKNFEPDSQAVKKGFIRLPASFTRIALPKIVLIKDLNYCISEHYAFVKYNKRVHTEDKKFLQAYAEDKKLLQWCEDTKINGLIFEPRDHQFSRVKRNGLFDFGF